MNQRSTFMENDEAVWPTLTTLNLLADGITSTFMPALPKIFMEHAAQLFPKLIDELGYTLLKIPETEEENRVRHLHVYLEEIRELSNRLHDYGRLLRKKNLIKSELIVFMTQKLAFTAMTLSVVYSQLNPLAGLVHDYVTSSEMSQRRRSWHWIHQQLINRIENEDIRLVAMNVIRECRPSQHNMISWQRLVYNNHLLNKLTELLRTTSRKKKMDQVLIDSLLQWEYYDDDFICYYIQFIEDSLEQAATRQEKRDLISHFYEKTELMQPTQPAFCFSIDTEESDALPPVKELLVQILNFHKDIIEEK